jgi:WD40 repeat protein
MRIPLQRIVWGLLILAACTTGPQPATTPAPTRAATRSAIPPPAPTRTATPGKTRTASAPAIPSRTPAHTPAATRTATRPPAYAGTPVPQPAATIGPDNAGRLALLAKWGKGQITEGAWSPDGRRLAVASGTGVHLYDARTFEEIGTIDPAGGSYVYSVVYSPDGRVLAMAAHQRLWLWRTADDGPPARLTELGPVHGVRAIAFAPDSQTLVSGDADGSFQLWRVADGTLVQQLSAGTDGVIGAAFGGDGRTVAMVTWTGTVYRWSLPGGALMNTFQLLENPADNVAIVAFSPDGAILAMRSRGGSGVELWRVSDGIRLRRIAAGAGALAFSPGGSLLATGVYDSVELWRVADGTRAGTLGRQLDGVVMLAFAPDGRSLATGTWGGQLQTWRVRDGAELQRAADYMSDVTSLSLSSDGALLATGSQDYTARLWRTADGQVVQIFPWVRPPRTGDDGPTGLKVAVAPDSRTVAVGTWDGAVQLWRLSDGALLHTLVGDDEADIGVVCSVAFSPDGRLLASACRGNVQLWDAGSGALLRTLDTRVEILALAFSPDSATLAVGGRGGAVQLWRAADGAQVKALTASTRGYELRALAFTPDGATLVAGTGQGYLRFYRIADGALIRGVGTGVENLWDLAISPDGRLLAVAVGRGSGRFGTVQLWQLPDGALLHAFEGIGGMYSVAFSPDGRLLYAGSFDNRVRVWGVPPP